MNTVSEYTIEKGVAGIVAFFLLLFSMWTIGHHAATFFHIPWITFSRGFLFLGAIILFFAYQGAVSFSASYSFEVQKNLPPHTTPSSSFCLLFLISVILITGVSGYPLKFFLSFTSFILFWWLTEKYPPIAECHEILPIGRERNNKNSFYEFALLFALVVIAVTVTLMIHRSDLDDASFLQIVAQTLLHQDKAPLTYDTSLGFVMDTFRFSPYRIASYETAIAFIAQWSGANLLTIYYIVVPAITAALTVCVAYLFTRWFLPSNKAIVATGIFLLIILAWGEAHRTFGNFGFVRLFQGKTLIIALTTPMTIIAGLLLIRSPTWMRFFFLSFTHVAAIGASSSGLVITFFTSLLLMVVSLQHNIKVALRSCLWIAASLVYPSIFIFWLKFQSGGNVPLSEVGSYAPINILLGLGFRETIALCAPLLGMGILAHGHQKKEYSLILLGTFLFILNPWLSDVFSLVSSRNMSWRLVWATPIPLLMSIGFAASLGRWPCSAPNNQKKNIPVIVSLVGGGLLVLFLMTARWTVSSKNRSQWGGITAKLPAEYYSTQKIADVLTREKFQGTVLSTREIAAWLPLVAPSLPIVMPGHTYPVMLQTSLPLTEFKNRMQLYEAVSNKQPDLSNLTNLLKTYQVTTIITQQDTSKEDIFPPDGHADNFFVREISSVSGYKVFNLHHSNQKQSP